MQPSATVDRVRCDQGGHSAHVIEDPGAHVHLVVHGWVPFETDQRYSSSHRWASTSTCSDNRFDLRGMATHEWGHSYGLGRTAQKSGLVMKSSSTVCDTAERALGLGMCGGSRRFTEQTRLRADLSTGAHQPLKRP